MDLCDHHNPLNSGLLAEHGHPDHQLRYSAEILADLTNPDRLQEAYKWVFIAWFLGANGAEEVSHYLRSMMPAGIPERSIDQAEEWLDNACETIRRGQYVGWSEQMLKIASGQLLPHQEVALKTKSQALGSDRVE